MVCAHALSLTPQNEALGLVSTNQCGQGVVLHFKPTLLLRTRMLKSSILCNVQNLALLFFFQIFKFRFKTY